MKTFLIYSLILIGIMACRTEQKPPEVKWTKKQSTEFNRNLVIEEELNIRMFLANRKTWKMEKTGSGLRYYIYQAGEGKKAEAGLEAEVKYQISLLDGTVCYKTDSLESESFKIDHSEVETGVQEGIKKMRVGDRAKLIVPSHLAHGLTGDRDKILPFATLVIDIELVGLK